jgi:hypothetical protein
MNSSRDMRNNLSPAKRTPKYWPAEIWCSRILTAAGMVLGGLSPFIQSRDARIISIAAACTLASLGLSFWNIRRKESREIARFEERPKVGADAFLGELEIIGSSPLAEKVLAVRTRLAQLGGVPPDSLRPSDRISGELRHLPFFDSLDYLGFVFILEEEMGVRIPDDKLLALSARKDSPTAIRDLIVVAIETSEQPGQ